MYITQCTTTATTLSSRTGTASTTTSDERGSASNMYVRARHAWCIISKLLSTWSNVTSAGTACFTGKPTNVSSLPITSICSTMTQMQLSQLHRENYCHARSSAVAEKLSVSSENFLVTILKLLRFSRSHLWQCQSSTVNEVMCSVSVSSTTCNGCTGLTMPVVWWKLK